MDKWRWIYEYENIYSVSINGEIFSTYKNRKLKPRLAGHCYYSVALYKNGKVKYKYIHKLVTETFIGKCPEGMEVMHISKIWNKIRKYESQKIDGSQKGNKNGNAKLKDNDVIKIKNLIKIGFTDREIGNNFNVDRRNIRHIRKGKTWTHL